MDKLFFRDLVLNGEATTRYTPSAAAREGNIVHYIVIKPKAPHTQHISYMISTSLSVWAGMTLNMHCK